VAWRRPQVEWRSEIRGLLNRVIAVVVVANVILILVTQFGDDEPSTSTSTNASTPVPASTAPGPRLAQPAATGRTQTVGGARLTLHTFQFPASGVASSAKPRSGNAFAAADIEGCAASAGVTKFDRLRFLVELSDQRRFQSISGVRQPALAPPDLTPGQCARGWVGFEVPQGARPAFLVYQGSSTVRWPIT
jgi:hypothetical protein